MDDLTPSDETLAWLTRCAASHPDRWYRASALHLRIGGMGYDAPQTWAIPSIIATADLLRERGIDADITNTMHAFTSNSERPRWGRRDALALVPSFVLVARLGTRLRHDDGQALRAIAGFDGAPRPTFTVDDALKASELARWYDCSCLRGAGLVGALGVETLCAIADDGGRDIELRILEAADRADLEFTTHRRIEVVMTYASVLRDIAIPADGTERWRRLLGSLCASRPYVDEVVGVLGDTDTWDLITQFTVDGVPVPALVALMADLPDWLRALLK